MRSRSAHKQESYPSNVASVTGMVILVEVELVLCLFSRRGKALARPSDATSTVGMSISGCARTREVEIGNGKIFSQLQTSSVLLPCQESKGRSSSPRH